MCLFVITQVKQVGSQSVTMFFSSSENWFVTAVLETVCLHNIRDFSVISDCKPLSWDQQHGSGISIVWFQPAYICLDPEFVGSNFDYRPKQIFLTAYTFTGKNCSALTIVNSYVAQGLVMQPEAFESYIFGERFFLLQFGHIGTYCSKKNWKLDFIVFTS